MADETNPAKKDLPKRPELRMKRRWQMLPPPEAIKSPVPEVGDGLSPLQYMLAVIRDPNVDYKRRDRMAIAAAPYCHPRVAEHQLTRRDAAAKKAKALGVLGQAHWGDDLRDLGERPHA